VIADVDEEKNENVYIAWLLWC